MLRQVMRESNLNDRGEGGSLLSFVQDIATRPFAKEFRLCRETNLEYFNWNVFGKSRRVRRL